MEPIRTSQEEMTCHFIWMAEGHRPKKSRNGKLTLFPQSGSGNGEFQPCLKLVTPAAQAVEQAKSDLKWGSNHMDILDVALERDAKRKKESEARKARWSKVTKKRATSKNPRKRTAGKKTANKKSKAKKSKPKKRTTGKKQTPGKKKTADRKGQKPKKKSTNGKRSKPKSKRK